MNPGSPAKARVAYFSMEVAFDSAIPTYSGGLGVLAGDSLRAAADLGLPMVGVSLLYRHGYFRQRLDTDGHQREEPVQWSPERVLERLPTSVAIEIAGRTVHVSAWRHRLRGTRGDEVVVYLLDTADPRNHPDDRRLTEQLYESEPRLRLGQEAVLGLGGVAFLRAAGEDAVHTWHLNEGHSALLTLALEEELARQGLAGDALRAAVRNRCVFTTHTPVPAGHDRFPPDLVQQVLGPGRAERIVAGGCCLDGWLNMTFMALHNAHFVNGVALRHRQVSIGLYPGYPIDSITNGVHAVTWTSKPFQEVFDHHMPEWRRANANLRYAIAIPLDDIRAAHRAAKDVLLAEVERRAGVRLQREVCTLGFARRATEYKRAHLVFSDRERLRGIARAAGGLQLVMAGKAHPRDEGGKEMIRRVVHAARELAGAVTVVWLEDYDLAIARALCAGVDVWLNTPARPQEASGTSGMKAALNGVPSLSVLDGWWLEGHVEGVTGWSIGEGWEGSSDDARDATALYDKLERAVLPAFHGGEAWPRLMRSTIALNGSFFNAERMMFQYAENAYGM